MTGDISGQHQQHSQRQQRQQQQEQQQQQQLLLLRVSIEFWGSRRAAAAAAGAMGGELLCLEVTTLSPRRSFQAAEGLPCSQRGLDVFMPSSTARKSSRK
ncbi:hypothetical protein Emag_005007 [Eimeria magna]